MALVGWWRFDGTVADSSGQQNDGTATGGPTYVAGKMGDCLSFDGVDDFVDIPDSANLSPTAALSVSAWFNMPAVDATGNMGIVTKDVSGAVTNPPYALYIPTGLDQVRFEITSAANANNAITSDPVSLGEWHHAVGTFSASDKKIYIDGVLDTSNTTGTDAGDTTGTLKIGQHKATFGRFFAGLIDDVRVYNHVLIDTEVLALFNEGIIPACIHEIGTADTGATPNTSGAFIPSLGDLLIAFVVASTTTQAIATLTNSTGLTFTQFGKAAYSSSANSIYGFVANALVTSAVSQTVTFDTASDAAAGTVIFVCAVAGMHKTGLAAIRQFAVQDNGSAAGTPAPAFSAACLTENPTLGCIGNNSSPAAMTPPTGWTEPATTGDLGYATPTSGGEYVFRDSGFTGTTVTWGGTSATVFGALIAELDASLQATGIVSKMLAYH